MLAARVKAWGFIQEVGEREMVRSIDPPQPFNKFWRLTNVMHSTLVQNWSAGGIQTCCIDHVIKYAQRMGLPEIHAFDLKSAVLHSEHPEAWVESKQGLFPKCGDILRHSKTHIDVAIGMRGKVLWRLAAGQGDGSPLSKHPNDATPRAPRSAEYDVIRWMPGDTDYNWANLQGWLDIDKYTGPEPVLTGVPDWLVGWWRLGPPGSTGYLYFDIYFQAKFTAIAPTDLSKTPAFTNEETAQVTPGAANTIALHWRHNGAVDRLTLDVPVDGAQLRGTRNGQQTITAYKMYPPPPQ